MHHGMSSYREIERLCSANTAIAGRFGRVFLHLPPLYMDPDQIRTIGAPNGPMKDTGSPNLAQTVPLGLIFFGQFIDHDITLDVTSTLSSVNDPAETPNLRTPTLDLDCVYGDGPEAHPFLFDGPKLITGTDMTAKLVNPGFADEDLPRSAADVAIIGDPRNDENRVISQMQLGFLRFHNKVVDILAARVPPPANIVHEAQRIVRWHYQWIVVNDYLRTICGNWVVDDILANGRKIYQPEDCYDRRSYLSSSPLPDTATAIR